MAFFREEFTFAFFTGTANFSIGLLFLDFRETYTFPFFSFRRIASTTELVFFPLLIRKEIQHLGAIASVSKAIVCLGASTSILGPSSSRFIKRIPDLD